MMHMNIRVTNFEFSGVSFPWRRVPGPKRLNLEGVIGRWIFLLTESITCVSAVAGPVSLFDNLGCLDRDGPTWAENKW